jgi:hypothetical protein
MTKYTNEDIPMILNSISWQLKRIADVLERDDHIDIDEETKPQRPNEPVIRSLLKNLNRS